MLSTAEYPSPKHLRDPALRKPIMSIAKDIGALMRAWSSVAPEDREKAKPDLQVIASRLDKESKNVRLHNRNLLQKHHIGSSPAATVRDHVRECQQLLKNFLTNPTAKHISLTRGYFVNLLGQVEERPRFDIPELAEETELVHTRWMIRRDLPEMLTTENASFEYAWTEEDFLRCLRQRNCIGMVAESTKEEIWPVIGYTLYELHKAKLHIVNFAVSPARRNSGIGSQMAAMVQSKLSRKRRSVSLEIRGGNLTGQLFFQKQGFQSTGVLRSFYEDNDEDAFVMEYPKIPKKDPLAWMRQTH